MEDQYLYWIVGAVGVPLVGWLKDQLKAEGTSAMLLTAAVAVVIALVVMFAKGDAALQDFSYANLGAAFGQVLASATLVYKLLLADKS